MLGIKTRLRDVWYRLWLTAYARQHPNAMFGAHIRLAGIPLFVIHPTAKVSIGAYVTFTSSVRANMAGIYKPCSLAVREQAELVIGEGCGFSGVSIYCARRVEIGRNLTCGVNVAIWDTDFHPLNHLERRANVQGAIKTKAILIGDDIFIGANAMVLKGVRLGDRCVVAAGSVVTKDIPPDEIWGGNPVRFLRRSADSRPAAD